MKSRGFPTLPVRNRDVTLLGGSRIRIKIDEITIFFFKSRIHRNITPDRLQMRKYFKARQLLLGWREVV